jgi:hypothetical protein
MVSRRLRGNRNSAKNDPCKMGLLLALAMLLWASSACLAHAAGYWTCVNGRWTSVGAPPHLAPIKTCGSLLEFPGTQQACELSGGTWGRAGLSSKPICRVRTRDAGRACADTGECEGLCLAALTPRQRDLVKQRRKMRLMGKCTPYAPVFGCMAIVREGFVTGLLCRD